MQLFSIAKSIKWFSQLIGLYSFFYLNVF